MRDNYTNLFEGMEGKGRKYQQKNNILELSKIVSSKYSTVPKSVLDKIS